MAIETCHRVLVLVPVFIAAFFYASNAFSQTWTACGTNVASGVSLDDGTWITVGARGEVRRSTDGGHSWTNRSLDLSEDLRGICRGKVGEAFVLSGSGSVYRTRDAGATWELTGRVDADSATTSYIDFLPDSNMLLIVDGNGTVYSSDDAGANWGIRHQSPDFLAADVARYANYLAMTSPEGRIQILRGLSDIAFDQVLDSAISIRNLSYIDSTLYAFGVRTDTVSTPYAVSLSSPDRIPERIYPSAPISIQSATKLPGDRILCVGGGIAFTDFAHAVIYYPLEDRWKSAELNLPVEYYALSHVSLSTDSSVIMAAGEQGMIALAEIPTDTNSIVWHIASRSPIIDFQLLPYIETPIQQVEDVNDSTVALIAEFSGKGRVMTSDDMGASWKTATAPHRMNNVLLFNRDSGIGSRLGTLNGHVPEMLFLTDSLLNITQERVKTNDFAFKKEGPLHFSEGRVLMGGYEYIYLSDDSGRTWRRTHLEDSVQTSTISVVGDGVVYCLGLFPATRIDASSLRYRMGIYRSLDNGESWSMLFDTSAINAIAAINIAHIDSATGLMETYAGDLLRTENNWKSYSVVASFGQVVFGPITMITDSLGYLLGVNNFIATTRDGGRSWQEVTLWNSRTDDAKFVFRDVALMPDNRTLFIVGHGIILRGEFDEDITGVYEREAFTRSKKLDLKIVPNPLSSDKIIVNISGLRAERVSIELYDNTGRRLATWNRRGAESRLSLELPSNVPSGIYTLVARSDDATGVASVTVLR